LYGDSSGVGRVLCELVLEQDGQDGGLDEEDPGQDGQGGARGHRLDLRMGKAKRQSGMSSGALSLTWGCRTSPRWP